MIYDAETETVLGNLGWVDGGSLWTFELNGCVERRIKVDGSDYVGVARGSRGLVRLVHGRDAGSRISIRHVSNLEVELASVAYRNGAPDFRGDIELWSHVERTAIVSVGHEQRVILIDAENERLIELDSTWFNSNDYDLGYQSLVAAILLEDLGMVAVSVQRSSKLVLIDLESNRRCAGVELAGRHGNPEMRRLTKHTILASDYDSLCLIELPTWAVHSSRPLQPPLPPNTHQFIGDYDVRGELCAVARPFSSDVLLLDLPNYREKARTPVKGQPLSLCMTLDSEFVTRDWKSGRVEVGSF